MNLLLRISAIVAVFSSISMAAEEESALPHYTTVSLSKIYESKHGDLVEKIYLKDLEKKFPIEEIDWTGFNIVDFIDVCTKERELDKVVPKSLYNDIFIQILLERGILPRLISTDALSVTALFMSRVQGNPRELLNKMGYFPKVHHSRAGTTYAYAF